MLSNDTTASTKFAFAQNEDQIVLISADSLDTDEGVIDLAWNDKCEQAGVLPDSVVIDDTRSPKPKPDSLSWLASRVLDGDSDSPGVSLAISILTNDQPRFIDDYERASFTDDLDEMYEWVTKLDRCCVAVQGPPGTGKTYSGARLVRHLVEQGMRVGITSLSHAAIDNLLRAVVDAFAATGSSGELNALRIHSGAVEHPVAGVDYRSAPPSSPEEWNVLAGTTWPFANTKMRESVDVLIIDEAGQVSLADVLACAPSTNSVVLLGDPQQLAHVSQAVHPGGSGSSVLRHVLGDGLTIAPDRGVFLSETRRMHPDVCEFVSEQFYEGRLHAHPDCADQSTELGTGLRWIRSVHTGRSTSSIEEAELVRATILDLIGRSWTDKFGLTSQMDAGDVLVVVPYNDQKNLVRKVLVEDERTEAVKVGTVDKFQGQEAPVVIFSMTASTGDDTPRGIDFLFSKNRLNVAISRAQALAYVICTDELLNARARDVEEMQLISALCAFVEHATEISSQ